jgi:hypothetical protein
MKIFRRQARGQGGRSQEMIPDPGTWTAGVPPTPPVEPRLREGSRPDGRRTSGGGATARPARERNQDGDSLGLGGVTPAAMLLKEMKPLVMSPAERHDVAGPLAAQPLIGQMMKLDSLPPAPWNRTRLRAAREDRPHLDELPPPRRLQVVTVAAEPQKFQPLLADDIHQRNSPGPPPASPPRHRCPW